MPQLGKETYPGKGLGGVGQPLAAAEVLVARCEPDTDINCTFHLLDLRFKISWRCEVQPLQTAHHGNSGLAYPEPLTAGCPLILKPLH